MCKMNKTPHITEQMDDNANTSANASANTTSDSQFIYEEIKKFKDEVGNYLKGIVTRKDDSDWAHVEIYDLTTMVMTKMKTKSNSKIEFEIEFDIESQKVIPIGSEEEEIGPEPPMPLFSLTSKIFFKKKISLALEEKRRHPTYRGFVPWRG